MRVRGILWKMFFGVPFYDQYSSVEFERMAWQCPAREGYHIDADALVLQFLDRNGQEVTAGHNGEVVCTSLFNFAMPLIRYAIGDVGTPTDKVCSCGRCLPLMGMVEGRKDALIVLPSGEMITPRAFTYAIHLFKQYDQIDQFRVVQKKLDLFEFKLKIKNKDFATNLEREFLSHLRTTLGFDGSAEFRVDFVDDVPLDKNGKLGIVVSELPATMKGGEFAAANQQRIIEAYEGG